MNTKQYFTDLYVITTIPSLFTTGIVLKVKLNNPDKSIKSTIITVK